MCLTDFPKWLIVLASLSLALIPACSCPAATPPSPVAPELRDQAISVLRAAMRESKAIERVHAAEALIWTGHPEGIEECFLEQDRIAGSETVYRIGIWRTLYRINADNGICRGDHDGGQVLFAGASLPLNLLAFSQPAGEQGERTEGK